MSAHVSYSLQSAEEVLRQKGIYDTVMFSSAGPAGVFGIYAAEGANLHRVLLNEFVTVTTQMNLRVYNSLTIKLAGLRHRSRHLGLS